jgi:hypothetical protein
MGPPGFSPRGGGFRGMRIFYLLEIDTGISIGAFTYYFNVKEMQCLLLIFALYPNMLYGKPAENPLPVHILDVR